MKSGLSENHLKNKQNLEVEKKKSPKLKAQVQLNEAITLIDIGHLTDDDVVVVDDDDADDNDDDDDDQDDDLSNRRSRYIGHLVPTQLKVHQIRPRGPL